MPRIRLNHRQYSRLSKFLLELYTFRDRDSFITHALTSLHSIIDCDLISYSEIDLAPNRVTYKWAPDEPLLRATLNPALERTIHEHPCIPFILHTQGAESVKISDVLSLSALKKLAYYQDFLRKVDTNFQLGSILNVRTSFFSSHPKAHSSDRSDSVHAPVIAFNRRHKDFEHADHAMMDLLRPHFIQAFSNAHHVNVFHALAEANGKFSHGDPAVVCATQTGMVRFATPRAQKLLGQYCRSEQYIPDELPTTLRNWLLHENRRLESDDIVSDPLIPLTIHGESGTLRICFVREGSDRLLIMEEQTHHHAFSAVDEWGLSLREEQILRWVTKGKTNQEIGIILEISHRTVQKHLERIYIKLGVENRTTAAALAIESLR